MSKDKNLLGTIEHPFTLELDDNPNTELLGTITYPFTFKWNENDNKKKNK